MICTYGQGGPTGIVAPLTHHARGVAVIATALMNGLLTSEVARDQENVHWLHIGRGAQGVNLHLSTGHTFAFRGRGDGHGYNRIEILDGVRNGSVLMTVDDPKQAPAAIELIEAALTEKAVAA